MSNTFSISVKPEVAAVKAVVDANNVILADVHDTDLPAAKTVIDENKVILADLHDTDIPDLNTKITTLDTVADNIRNIDVPNIQANIDANGTILADIHDTDLPAAVTKIDDNKAVLDILEARIMLVKPSDVVLHTNADVNSAAVQVYTKLKETICNVSGTIRISFDLKTGHSGTVYGKIYINNVAVGTERSQSEDDYTTYTEDLNVQRGDAIQIWGKHSAASSYVIIQNLILKGTISDTYISVV